MFAEVVYGLDPAILSYSAETRRYMSLVESESKENVVDDACKKAAGNSEQTSLEKQVKTLCVVNGLLLHISVANLV